MGNLWWGYRHANGSYQVKRFFDQIDIDEAWESPFVDDVTQPFEAEDHKDALAKAKGMLV